MSHAPGSPSRTGVHGAFASRLSAGGGFVAFSSLASDLVARDFNGSIPDVFLYVPGEI